MGASPGWLLYLKYYLFTIPGFVANVPVHNFQRIKKALRYPRGRVLPINYHNKGLMHQRQQYIFFYSFCPLNQSMASFKLF
jgi:hypothetical protein